MTVADLDHGGGWRWWWPSSSCSDGSGNDGNSGGSGIDSDGNDNEDGNWQLFFFPLLTTVGPSEGTITYVVHSYNTAMRTQLLLPSHFAPVGNIIAIDNINHPDGSVIT